MKKITKQEVKKIMGDGATTKQVEIVFSLIELQAEGLKEKISKEIQKLEAKRDEALKKIETDFQKKSEQVFDKTLSKAVQDILKRNGIKISQPETEKISETDSEAEEKVEENFSENEKYLEENLGETEEKSETNFSQSFYNRY